MRRNPNISSTENPLIGGGSGPAAGQRIAGNTNKSRLMSSDSRTSLSNAALNFMGSQN